MRKITSVTAKINRHTVFLAGKKKLLYLVRGLYRQLAKIFLFLKINKQKKVRLRKENFSALVI